MEKGGELLDEVVKYLTTGEYPIGRDNNNKRSIRRKAKKFKWDMERCFTKTR